MNMCMVSSEVVPYAKTGGLADVVGALAVEFARVGHDVCVIMPCYRGMLVGDTERAIHVRLSVPTATGPIEVDIHEITVPQPAAEGGGRLRVFGVRHDPSFDRPGLYQEGGVDYPDNFERFVLFSRAVMELLVYWTERNVWRAELLHLHDWQAALCAVYLKTLYRHSLAELRLRSVLTIHNLGYQGLYPAARFADTGLPPQLFSPDGLEFYGSLNILKGGLVYADRLTTVSPTYSEEIQTLEYGCGLEGVVRARAKDLHGIVNGIDVEAWNPATDAHLAANYSSAEPAGKARCKKALQRELQLECKPAPLIGIIARLTEQKGIDLVLEIVPELMELPVQLAVLGTGDALFEQQLKIFAADYPGRIAVRNRFDEGLAHRIEAGADLFLMPSRYEPCGLSQLYSLRYGTVPVVRKTGGLADTVVTYAPRALKAACATGFSFTDPSAEPLLTALLLALSVYRNKKEWRTLMAAGMAEDLSWSKSAAQYVEIFEALRLEGVEAPRY